MVKKLLKESLQVGIGSMAGMGAIGAMGSVPGMPASPVAGIVGSSVGLANVGQLAKTGMGIAGMMNTGIKKDKKSKNCRGSSKGVKHNMRTHVISKFI